MHNTQVPKSQSTISLKIYQLLESQPIVTKICSVEFPTELGMLLMPLFSQYVERVQSHNAAIAVLFDTYGELNPVTNEREIIEDNKETYAAEVAVLMNADADLQGERVSADLFSDQLKLTLSELYLVRWLIG